MSPSRSALALAFGSVEYWNVISEMLAGSPQ